MLIVIIFSILANEWNLQSNRPHYRISWLNILKDFLPLLIRAEKQTYFIVCVTTIHWSQVFRSSAVSRYQRFPLNICIPPEIEINENLINQLLTSFHFEYLSSKELLNANLFRQSIY